MTDQRAHRATIRWSKKQEERGLPTFSETADPVWGVDETPKRDEGWTLLCDFPSPPSSQGNPSLVRVRFLMPEAPYQLAPGLRLKLFERATSQLADLEILD
jgi:hypothetical protein